MAESHRLRPDVEKGVVDLVLQPFSDAADDAIEALTRHGVQSDDSTGE